MISTLYRRPDADDAPAPAFDVVDPLSGIVPTWRLDEEPIYLELVAVLGVPGSLLGPAPAGVVAGEVVAVDPDDEPVVDEDDAADVDEEYPRGVVEAPPTVPIPLRPTTAIPVTGRGGRKRRQPNARRAAS